MSPAELLEAALGDLSPNPLQPRKQFAEEELAGLAATLAEGQLQPILAYRDGERFVIIDGERRWRAAGRAGLKSLLVMVVEPPAGTAALEKALVSNIQRADLGPLEKARAIERLIRETGQPAAEIAKRLGICPGNVSKLLKLLTLPGGIQQQIESGEISAASGYMIARATEPGQQEELAEDAAGGATRDELAAKVRSPGRREGSGGSKRQARYVARLGGGRTITFSGAALDSVESLIEWVEQLLVKARKVRSGPQTLDTFLRMLRDEAGGAA